MPATTLPATTNTRLANPLGSITSKGLAALALSAGALLSPASGQTVVNGTLEAGDIENPERFFRDGTPDNVFPGLFGVGPFYYDIHTFHNPTGTAQTGDAFVTTDPDSTNIYTVVYLFNFDYNNPSANFHWDQGASQETLPLSLNIPAFTEFQFVIMTTTGLNTQAYTLTVPTPFKLGNYVIAAPALPAAGPAKKEEEPAFLVADTGAITSLLTTGLAMPVAQRAVVQGAPNAALRDLGGRLFNARAHLANGGSGVASTLESGSTGRTLNNFLAFNANQNIDTRVALGLRDEADEVKIANTLNQSQQTLWVGGATTLVGGPIAMAAQPFASAKAVVPVSSGKDVVDDSKVVFEPVKRFEIFTAFDYGYYDQDTLTSNDLGFDVDSYTATAGVEYLITDWLAIGAAWSHLESDSELLNNLGGIDLEGHLLSGYLTAFHGNTWADVLYSYGNYDNDINRNTLLGSRAMGETESYSHNISVNAGHNFGLLSCLVTGPGVGLDYATGGINGYTETGGGNANLVYPDDNFESMIGRLGWSVSYARDAGFLGKMTAQARAGWAHEFMPEADAVSASLLSSPFILIQGNRASRVGGFGASEDSAHAGQDWLELGAGVRFDLDCGLNLKFDYTGQFGRNNASAHFGSAKLGYEF